LKTAADELVLWLHHSTFLVRGGDDEHGRPSSSKRQIQASSPPAAPPLSPPARGRSRALSLPGTRPLPGRHGWRPLLSVGDRAAPCSPSVPVLRAVGDGELLDCLISSFRLTARSNRRCMGPTPVGLSSSTRRALDLQFLRPNGSVPSDLQVAGAGEKTGKATSRSLCRCFPGASPDYLSILSTEYSI
jgi:hypothetical protein